MIKKYCILILLMSTPFVGAAGPYDKIATLGELATQLQAGVTEALQPYDTMPDSPAQMREAYIRTHTPSSAFGVVPVVPSRTLTEIFSRLISKSDPAYQQRIHDAIEALWKAALTRARELTGLHRDGGVWYGDRTVYEKQAEQYATQLAAQEAKLLEHQRKHQEWCQKRDTFLKKVCDPMSVFRNALQPFFASGEFSLHNLLSRTFVVDDESVPDDADSVQEQLGDRLRANMAFIQPAVQEAVRATFQPVLDVLGKTIADLKGAMKSIQREIDVLRQYHKRFNEWASDQRFAKIDNRVLPESFSPPSVKLQAPEPLIGLLTREQDDHAQANAFLIYYREVQDFLGKLHRVLRPEAPRGGFSIPAAGANEHT